MLLSKFTFKKYQVTYSSLVDQATFIQNAIEEKRGLSVTYINHHVFNLACNNNELSNLLEDIDILSIDSIGMSLFLSLSARKMMHRTVMTYLFDELFSRSFGKHYNAVLIGATAERVKIASEKLNEIKQNIEIIEHYDGYQKIEDYINLLKDRQDIPIIFIGMASPKSEEFIYRARKVLKDKIIWNIGGGTVNCYAGYKRRAPKLVSRLGIEWIHRIIFEPEIRDRYFKGIPLFLRNVVVFENTQ